MTQYSSDEEEEEEARPASTTTGEKRTATFGGGKAFAEVVRARMKLKDDLPAEPTAKTV
jgi:hypothetical protein